jgi:hypothetical protein
MAHVQSTMTMSDDELRQFAGKLRRWGQRLSPKEQQFLGEMLGRAAGEDVQGYAVDMFLKLAPVTVPGGASWIKGEGPFLKITDVKGE